MKMNNIIGFYKELDADEKIIKESPHLVEIYEKRGLSFFGIKLKEFKKDPDVSFAKLFLTNKKLIFLTLFVGDLKELKSGKGDLAGIVTEWSFIPLSKINKIDAPKAKFFDLLFNQVDEDKGQLILHYGKSELHIVLAQRDMWGALIDEYAKIEEREENINIAEEAQFNFSCPLCGTNYDRNGVKIVVCSNCSRKVCREKKTGIFFNPKWELTRCFSDEYVVCKHCLVGMQTKKSKNKV